MNATTLIHAANGCGRDARNYRPEAVPPIEFEPFSKNTPIF